MTDGGAEPDVDTVNALCQQLRAAILVTYRPTGTRAEALINLVRVERALKASTPQSTPQ